MGAPALSGRSANWAFGLKQTTFRLVRTDRNGKEETMILRCNYEELGALRTGATSLLGGSPGERAPVVAPPEGFEDVMALLPRLDGDLAMETLAEQRQVLKGISAIVQRLKEEMDASVLATHPAGEVGPETKTVALQLLDALLTAG